MVANRNGFDILTILTNSKKEQNVTAAKQFRKISKDGYDGDDDYDDGHDS